MLVESGMLREEEGEFVTRAAASALAIPASLQASLMARLDRLAPVKEVAQIGAVIGREFSYELLAAVARRTDAQLTSALDQLTEAGLVFVAGRPRTLATSSSTRLCRMPHTTRFCAPGGGICTRRIGHVLEESFPEIATSQPELLAHHFAEAGLETPR